MRSLLTALVAVAAAGCYAASNVIEQRKAAEAPPESSLRIGLLWHLAHERVWWLGIAVDVGGFGFQVLALGLGSLVFVQPLLVTSLLFSLVLGARFGSHHLSSGDLGWAVVLVGSLCVFLLATTPDGGVAERPLRSWLPYLVVIYAGIGACVLGATRAPGPIRAALLAAAAGASFGVSSTLMKSFGHLVGRGPVAMLSRWEPYVMGLVIAVGFLILQSAFQAGDLRAALPALEATEPVVACVLGLALMGERVHVAGAVGHGLIVASVVAMAWSTVQLAQSAAEVRAPAGAT